MTIKLLVCENFDLDLNDILNDKLMPATLFLQPFVKGSNITRKHFYSIDEKNGTSNIDDALNMMKFHRSKMNEYMASNFVAKQIVSSLSLNPTRMQRRLGVVDQTDLSSNYENYNNLHNRVKFPAIADSTNLLYDSGSQGYKKWLERSTTLDDIHRQFGMSPALYMGYDTTSKPPLSFKRRNRNGSASSTDSEESEENNNENEYEEGETNGYIYPKQNLVNPTNAPIINSNLNYGYNQNGGYSNVPQVNYAQPNPINHVYTYHKPQTPSPTHLITSPAINSQPVAVSATGYDNGGGYRKFPAQIGPTANSKSVLYYQNTNPVVNENISNDQKQTIVHQYPPHQNYNNPTSQTGNLEDHTKKQGYYGPTGHETYEQPEDHHHYPVENSEKKEISLKDVLDIALTTLAFLSFGMFILQVLICLTTSTNYNNYSSNMMMMTPMDASGEIDDGVEEIRRKKRSIEIDRIIKVNELSKRVLLSIDGFIHASEDNGTCLQRILCENNLFARKQNDGQKIWMPIWSLAVSWLMNSKGLALQNLKATAIGLGGGNCESFHGCSILNRK